MQLAILRLVENQKSRFEPLRLQTSITPSSECVKWVRHTHLGLSGEAMSASRGNGFLQVGPLSPAYLTC